MVIHLIFRLIMIRGTIEDRIKYEQIIKESETKMDSSLSLLFDWFNRLHRYFKLRLRRGAILSSSEKGTYYLVVLMMEVCRVVNVSLRWYLYDYIPMLIRRMKTIPPAYSVRPNELSALFLQFPKQVLESVLISSGVLNNTLYKALDAYESENQEILSEIFNDIPLDKTFSAYQYLIMVAKALEGLENFEYEDALSCVKKLRYLKADLFDTLKSLEDNDHIPGSVLPRLEYEDSIMEKRFRPFSERLESGDDKAIEKLIKFTILLLDHWYSKLLNRLGEKDPVIISIERILDAKIFSVIPEFYPIDEGDIKHFDEILKYGAKLYSFMDEESPADKVKSPSNQNDTQADFCYLEKGTDNGQVSSISHIKSNKRLPYPYRFENHGIAPLKYNAILSRIYNNIGRYFIDSKGNLISEESFIYFFSGIVNCPDDYNPPYYWNTDPKIFAAYLRVLYFGKRLNRDFKKLVLRLGDKDPDKSWGSFTPSLGEKNLTILDNEIRNIVREISGIELGDVDLSRK